jgi:hypothetical protein
MPTSPILKRNDSGIVIVIKNWQLCSEARDALFIPHPLDCI